MFFKKNRKAPEEDGLNIEEIQEKPTTKIGSLLLIIMAVIILFFGEWLISDIRDFIKSPVPPTNCFMFSGSPEQNSSPYYYYGRYDSGSYSELDKKYGLDIACQKIAPIKSELSSISDQKNSEEYSLRKNKDDYNLVLQEIQAGQGPNYEILKAGITKSEQNIREYGVGIASLNEKIKAISDENLKNFQLATNEFQRQNAWYILLVFLARLLVIGPLFIIALIVYRRLKKKNSPHSIIAGAVLIPSVILLCQITIGSIWRMIPESWIQALMTLFSQLVVFRYVIYYGVIVIAILIIGGFVFFIQKRVFSPQKVAQRRLKENKCPKCEFPILNNFFCSKCGYQIKEECQNCKNARFTDLPFCPFCKMRK